MNKRTVVVLGVILLFFVLTYILLAKFVYKPRINMPFKNINVSSINKISISKGETAAVFQKQEGKWKLTDSESYVVDEDSIKEALDSFKDIEIKEVISEDPAKFEKFEVTKASGTSVDIFVGAKNGDKLVFSAILGKSAQNYMHYYAKLPKEEKVRLVSGVKKYLIENARTSWRNKVITQFEKDNFISASITKDKTKYEITKSSDIFLVNNKEAKKEDVDSFIASIANLRAYEYADEKLDINAAAIALGPKCKFTMDIKTAQGGFNVKIGGADSSGSKFYLMKEGDQTIYFIGKYYTESIEKALEKLK